MQPKPPNTGMSMVQSKRCDQSHRLTPRMHTKVSPKYPELEKLKERTNRKGRDER